MANTIDADGTINEQNAFRVEAAEQFGFESIDGEDAPGQPGYFCTEDELIAFAKACERKGMADAKTLVLGVMENRPVAHFVHDFRAGFKHGAYVISVKLGAKIAAIDVELAPVLESERVRFLTVRGEDDPC